MRLKYFYTIVFILLCILSILIINNISMQKLLTKKTEQHFHYLLPSIADCAVKEMFFKQSDGSIKKQIRTVCHWHNP